MIDIGGSVSCTLCKILWIRDVYFNDADGHAPNSQNLESWKDL